jgi:hypothetical protein
MWWLVLILCLLIGSTIWQSREGLENQEPQSSAEVIAQTEMNRAAIDDLAAKIKELQASSKRIDEVENSIQGTTEMLKSINTQCSKTG